MDEREIHAYHEAGHAVRCYQRGRKFKSVSILQVGRKRPGVEIDWGSPTDERELRRLNQDKVAIYTSGFAAEDVIGTGRKFDPLREDDYKKAAEAARQLDPDGDERWDEIMREKFDESVTDVKKDWRAVEALARELITHEALNYEVAIQIIKSSLS
jgi:hypothetical protein